ncbi:short-chain dehydrogenase/reductase SDR [Hyaloraphidium curvatum]|nr:short-chain dehydrogenase/reductase SDR [Hyaloraphidium curvatum]
MAAPAEQDERTPLGGQAAEPEQRETPRRKTAFISGAAGGLGRATAELLAAKGWRVIAADRDEAALSRLRERVDVDTLVLDVADPASVQAAAEKLRALSPGLDGIVNFAGILAVGSVIELPEETLRRIFEVNVFGTYRVNRALFPLLLERKGRIVNISSETGWQSGMPFNGAYAMTKHAVEAYSDSLRRELRILGVRVVKIQPGPFRTDMTATIGPNFERAAAESHYFGCVLRRMLPRAVAAGGNGSDPRILAEAVLEALTAESPAAAYSVRPAWDRTVLDWLPTRLADHILHEVLKL